MEKFKEFNKILALVLSSLVIMIPSGCYSVKSIPRNNIQYSGKPYYYIHGTNSEYPITAITLSDGVLSGEIVDSIKPRSKSRVIHVYIAPDSMISFSGNFLKVPTANIAKAEIFELDMGSSITILVSAATAAFWSVLLITLLIKGLSCPFVYSEDGEDINLEGEIYSGATSTPIERDDYLKLKSISPVDNQYRIRITNEVKEIQNTNLAELLVFDHSCKSEIIVDKYGAAHSVSATQKPLEASDAYGRSIIEELSGIDDIRYLSDIKNDELVFDTISLSFEKPENSNHARLVLSGKNTMWLDYMFGRFSDLFGRRHDEWKERRNSRTREELVQWTIDQGIPLSVWLEKDTGLEFVDYFNVPGPVVDKKDVLNIDLSGISGNKVNVKLVSGVLFWDIDFAGMDFSAEEEPLKTVVLADKAIDESGKDVTSLLTNDDDRYLIQPFVNNEARLSFAIPPEVPGLKRTVYLHSKGNYEVLRDAKGKPDMELLNNFLKPGMFTRFTKEHYLRYYSIENLSAAGNQ